MAVVEWWSVEDIHPAPYNPRKIEDERIEELKESITKVGFVIPVLINRSNSTIVAGHQRTKTAKLLGIDTVPAVVIDDIDLSDEMRFNQIHNGIDLSLDNRPKLLNLDYPLEEFVEIPQSEFEQKKARAASVKEICSLMLKYGNCLSCIVCKGEVLYGAEYLKACQILKYPVRTYIAKDEKYKDIRYYMNQSYGEFSYDHLEKHTYVQGLAQKFRDPTGTAGPNNKNKSWLHVRWLIPYLKKQPKGKTVLDFGSGKGSYIPVVNRLGYPCIGMEFYNNNGGQINSKMGNQMIDNLIATLKTQGLFDVVICCAVLNSVDSLEAEDAVMTCVNMFSKDKVFFSGRSKSYVDIAVNGNRDGTTRTLLNFLDKDGFTAAYRRGQWFFQKLHTEQQIRDLAEKHGIKILKLEYSKSESGWFAYGQKVANLPMEQYKKAIDFEFQLVLPGNKRYNRNNEVWDVIQQIYNNQD